jgi:membrane-associated phospholipid phosphatase
MILDRKFLLWLGTGGIVALLCLASIRWLDQPAALLFRHGIAHADLLSQGLGSTVLIAGELAVMAALAIVRVWRHKLSATGETLLVACCASLCTFAGNDHVLKLLFGRPNPATVLFSGVPPAFQFFQGTFQSSFPSGHMAMACSFGMVLLLAFPRYKKLLASLLALAGIILVVGDWHFISDVIAGSYVGGLTGFWAWELWMAHNRRGA